MKKKILAVLIAASILVPVVSNAFGVDGTPKQNIVQAATISDGWTRDDNGYWVYLRGGQRSTGWDYINYKWYYFNESGVMETGWKYINNKWYYLNSEGDMRYGWLPYLNCWFYMGKDGSMSTGWVFDNNQWYYLNNDGIMQKGWQYVGNKWYYLYENGAMAKDTTIGQYVLGSDGAMQDSYIDWDLTNKLNEKAQTLTGYRLSYKDDQKSKINDLIQSCINISQGKDVLDSIKTPWAPDSYDPNYTVQYIRHEVNVVVGETNYYYPNMPIIKECYSDQFKYVIAYWDSSINNYKLYHVAIGLK